MGGDSAKLMGMIIIRQTLYLTADGSRVVELGHVDAAKLYCTRGDWVDEEELARLGWTRPETKASYQAKAMEAAPENKALEMPARQPRRARLVKK